METVMSMYGLDTGFPVSWISILLPMRGDIISTEDTNWELVLPSTAILSEVTGRRAGYMDISRGYLIRVMDHLSTGYHDNLPNQERDSYSRKLFDSVSQFMKENIQSISMAALSAEFHFQPNYFNNLIKKHTGLTYSDYLIHLRMELARSFLENSGASVEEIMWLCGYSNKGFFYRKFTEHTGLSPSKYRAAHRQRR